MILWDDRFTIDTINETILQYYDGSEIPTLPINIDGYSVYFIQRE